jgi:hypothetical protein
MMVVGNGKQFQMVFHNQKELLLPFLPQIQKIRESSMPLTTEDYFVLLIQVFLGENWMYHGQRNIFHNILGH